MTDIQAFTERVVAMFAAQLTNQVFLMIEDDATLHKDYKAFVQQYSQVSINTQIGKAVKKRFGATEDTSPQTNRKSKLIKSHQKFK